MYWKESEQEQTQIQNMAQEAKVVVKMQGFELVIKGKEDAI